LLALAASLLFFDESFLAYTAASFGRWNTYFGLVSLLHSTSLVLSLRSAASYKRQLAFVLITTILSIGVPYVGLTFTSLLGLTNDVGFYSALGIGSAGGAFAYWILIRGFWIPYLPFWSMAQTVSLCVAATLNSFLIAAMLTGFGRSPNRLSDKVPTIFWWVAFSFSLFTADRSRWLTPRGDPHVADRPDYLSCRRSPRVLGILGSLASVDV
jgi:hypothetical protein